MKFGRLRSASAALKALAVLNNKTDARERNFTDMTKNGMPAVRITSFFHDSFRAGSALAGAGGALREARESAGGPRKVLRTPSRHAATSKARVTSVTPNALPFGGWTPIQTSRSTPRREMTASTLNGPWPSVNGPILARPRPIQSAGSH